MTKNNNADHSKLCLHILLQCEDSALARWIAVKVFPGDWIIDVEASGEWIVIDWEHLKTVRESTEATRHRSAGTPWRRK
jgi:hypothetical protein